MTWREIRASGRPAQELVTQLLQRARLADREAGIWEASDFQWWTRRPRASDDIDQVGWAKIGYGEPGAGGLYRSLGFRDPVALTAYERPA